MTFRITIKCTICKNKSIIKVQAGFLEESQVKIGCPNCGSLLKGKLLQKPLGVSLNFDNAVPVHEKIEELTNIPIIPISTELPIPKISSESIGSMAITINPYMALLSYLPYDKIEIFKQKYLSFCLI